MKTLMRIENTDNKANTGHITTITGHDKKRTAGITASRLTAAIMAIVLILAMTACSNNKENNPVQITTAPEVTLPVDDAQKNDNNSDPDGPEISDNNSPDGTGSWEGSRYISLHSSFSSKSGDLDLILTGSTKDSAAYVLDALKDFDINDDTPFRLEHDEFVDAEKWDTFADTYEGSTDSNQCWAASVSNILLISGWAEGHNDTLTGKPFESEDTIFEYYNARITNRGCDAKQALGWFFTGGFSPDWESSHPAMLIDDPDPADGIIKDFVITSALQEYCITDDILQIAKLEALDMNSSKPAVFEGSIGFLFEDGELTRSEHSITVVGIITDPEAKNERERYKAIIIADSDNDGCPDDSFENTDEMTIEEKNADKEARPNSYTVYKLNLNKDVNGKEYWELLGYGEEQHTVLYKVVALPMVSAEIVDEFRETEGSCSVIDDPDFVPGKLFTTSNTESVMDPIFFDKEEAIQTVFGQGEAVNLNFFITNIGFADFDPERYENAVLTADWKVLSEDKLIMASGTVECNEEISSSLFGGCLVNLNTVDGEIQSWPAGRYTAAVAINTDHAIKEAYFLNNNEAECEFEIQ